MTNAAQDTDNHDEQNSRHQQQLHYDTQTFSENWN